MKKLFLITSVLMLALMLFSVCFAERITTSGRVSNASGKADYMEEEEEETTSSRGTSTGSRDRTGTGVATRPSASTTTTDSETDSETDFTLELIEFTVEAPETGKALATKVVGKSNLASYTFNVPVVADASTATDNYAVWSPADTTAKAGTEYSIKIVIPINLKTISVSKDCKATINGNSVPVNGLAGNLFFDYKFGKTTTGTFTRPTTGSTVSRPKTISKIELTIPEITDGGAQIKADDITITDGTEITSATWTNVTKSVFMSANETYRKDCKYSTRVYFKASTGYVISTEPEVIVNGDKIDKVSKLDDGRYMFDKEFEIKTTAPTTTTTEKKTISKVEFTVPELKAGGDRIEEKDIQISEGAKFAGFTWANKKTSTFMMDTEKYEEGVQYQLNMFFSADEGYEFKDVKATVNGEEVKIIVVKAPNELKFEKIFEVKKEEVPEEDDEDTTTIVVPEQEEMINHFAFEITAPKIGEKPATTAKATKNGYTVKKVIWSPSTSKFEEGRTYTVEIYFNLDTKNVRSDYFATVNGKDADLPDGDENFVTNTMYAVFTFPTLRDASKKATWTKASSWAVDELNEAAEKGIIPDSLNKEDLTKNVTRKEFAHIAVRLYEELTGTGIKSKKNPFTDTTDEEVIKAYTVGITEGTDKEKGLFSPDKEITREQMATMMKRALDKAYIDTFVDVTKLDKFVDDSDLHDWSRDAVYFMNSKGIIKGVSNTENRFGAKGNATREQALLIAERSLKEFSK